MAAVYDIRDFRGIDYVSEGRLLTPSHALAIQDAKVWDGSIRTFPCPEVCGSYAGVAETLVDCDLCPCTTWDSRIHIVWDCNDIVAWTGDDVPRIAEADNFCEGGGCPLDFPCPSNPPEVLNNPPSGGYAGQSYPSYPSISDVCGGDNGGAGNGACATAYQGDANATRYTSYFYTNVYTIGGKTFESAPGPASAVVSGNAEALITGMIAPEHPCFTGHRVYRIESGVKTGEERESPVNNAVVCVAETTNATEVAMALTATAKPAPPLLFDYGGAPDDLKFLHSTEAEVYFGLVGREMWYTLPGRINTWSRKRRRTIKRQWGRPLALVTHNDDIYVLTDKHVIWYRMALGDSGPTLTRHIHRPITPLLSEKAITVSEIGVVFPSDRGLVAVLRDQIQVISSPFFDHDRWRQLDPDSMVAAVYGDTYVMSTSVDAFLFAFDDTLYSERTRTHVVGLNMGGVMIGAEAMATCDRGILIANGGTVYYWDWYQHPLRNHRSRHCDETLDRECCPFFWRSRIEDENRSFTYTAAEIHFGNEIPNPEVTFRIWEGNCDNEHDCGCELIEECVITDCEPFRLPGCRRGEDHWVEIEGCAHVLSVTLATSFHALRGDGRGK